MKTPPPLFSRREKYSLVLCSVAFIAFSGMVHTMVGSVANGMFPHFIVEPTPSPPPFSVDTEKKHPPRPTPTPHATPTPPPPPKIVVLHLSPIHPPKNPNPDHQTVGPTEQPYIPPTPDVATPSSPPATPTAEPITSATPSGPIDIQQSTFRYKAPPDYPQLEIEEHIEGTAIVLVTIGPDGSLLSATIATSSGDVHLDEAALAAARASRYTPYLVNGVPVEQQYKIVYDFRLDQ
jgi:periplasmic protein TonB